ncbi:MAG: ABC transporter substrate-binding protein, partial [Chloroflexota bacterium]
MFNKLFIGLVLMAMALTACAPAQTATPTQAPTKPVATSVPPTAVLPTDTATPEPLTPIKIKIGLSPYGSYLPLYIAQAEGYYAEAGLDAEFVDFTRQPDAIAALATGQVDAIGIVLDSGSLGAIAQGTGMMMVADKGYVKPDGCPYSAWMVRNELFDPGPLDDLAGARGLKAAVPKAGFFEYAMDMLLAPAGLSTQDLEVIDMPAPTRLEALGTGALDIAQMSEPWITRALQAGSAKIWYPFETTQPNA